MTTIETQATRALGVRLPDCYANFLAHHGSRLAADPVTEPSWIQGLGNLDFMIGTTQSFRSAFPTLPPELIVIGYAGKKFIQKLNEEIDLYTTLNTSDISIGVIDALGQWQTTNAHFFDWLSGKLIEALLRLDHPCELFVVGFDREDQADGLQHILHQLEREHLIELDDLVLVNRNAHRHLEIFHRHQHTAGTLAAGGLTGLLIGTLLLNPLVGAALGAVTGATSLGAAEALKHAGMDDDFVEELACLLKPGVWAVFVLVKAAHRRQVLERIGGLGGKLLSATVSGQDQAALQSILDGSPDPGAVHS